MGKRPSTLTLLLFINSVATVFVGMRIWEYSREVAYLETQLRKTTINQRALTTKPTNKDSIGSDSLPNIVENGLQKAEYFYLNVQPNADSDWYGSAGTTLDSENIRTMSADEEVDVAFPLLGQIDGVEDGFVHGWACQKGMQNKPIRVGIYINNFQAGFVIANSAPPQNLNRKICSSVLEPWTALNGVAHCGFRFRLPVLRNNLYQVKPICTLHFSSWSEVSAYTEHGLQWLNDFEDLQVRAFGYHPDELFRKELNMSPARFAATDMDPGLAEVLRRKEDVILARNAQIASLYEEVHAKATWEAVTRNSRINSFHPEIHRATSSSSRLLVFVGVNSDANEHAQRALLRQTWVPQGESMRQFKEEQGVMVHFIVGVSEWMDGRALKQLKREMELYRDITTVNIAGYETPSKKNLGFLRTVALSVDADFYFKVEKEVVLDLQALAEFLTLQKNSTNLYLGCMESGEVITSSRKRWYEPEHWRFGDPAGQEKVLTYHRHAHGRVYGLSNLVAKYLAQNAEVLHGFAHEDVSMGAWLLGLSIHYKDEPRLCCTETTCMRQNSGQSCIASFDSGCMGSCKRMGLETLYWRCVLHTYEQR